MHSAEESFHAFLFFDFFEKFANRAHFELKSIHFAHNLDDYNAILDKNMAKALVVFKSAQKTH